MTWKFIYTYREQCKTGPAHKRCWNLNAFLRILESFSQICLGPLARESPCIILQIFIYNEQVFIADYLLLIIYVYLCDLFVLSVGYFYVHMVL